MKRRLSTAAILASVGCLASCGNILGLRDFQLDPDLEGGADDGPGGDVEPMGDGMHKDSPGGDGQGGDSAGDSPPSDGPPGGDGSTDTVGQDVEDASMDTVAQDSPNNCDAGLTLCNGTCVDTTGDKSNCGACGHSCLGGNCNASMCAAVNLSIGVQAWDLDVDPQYVDFVNAANKPNGFAARCATGGCASPTIVTGGNGEDGPERIVYDPATLSIYWTVAGSGGDSAVYKSDFQGSTKLASSPDYAEGIAVDATYVYWAVRTASGSIMRVPKNGGSATTFVPGLASPYSVVVSGGYLYWTFEAGSGGVGRCLISSCSAGTIVNGGASGSPEGLAVDSRIYWTESAANGDVWSAQLNGSSPVLLASGQNGSFRIASDGKYAYWTTLDGGTVMRCLGTGCNGSPDTLASGLNMPMGIAVDGVAVYYDAYGASTLYKLAR